jgi:alkylation response protein AidB-like acyl-CoA dehydrogenase
MDALFDEAENLLQETARRVVSDLACGSVQNFEHFDPEKARSEFAALGLLGIRLPEHAGGGAGTTVDATIVVNSIAEGLLPIPFLGASLASELLMAAGASASTLERVARGDLLLSIGLTNDLSHVWGSDPAGDEGDVIGFDSAQADALIILEPESRRLKAIEPRPAEDRFDVTRTIAVGDADEIVDVGDLGDPIAPDAMDRFLVRALALMSADLVGVMSAALDAAVEHASARIQFGTPIGSFQALQHLAADQLVSLEGAKSLAEYAAWVADEPDILDALDAARSAKAYCSRAARTLCEAVVQIHGGMGFTWECMAHLYLKRALVDGRVLGDYTHHIEHLGRARRQRAT